MYYLVLPERSKFLSKKSVMFRPVKSSNVSVVFWTLCKDENKFNIIIYHFKFDSTKA